VNVDLVGTIVLIVLSLVSIVVRCIWMAEDRDECAGHCGQTHPVKQMEFIGGGYFCRSCLEDLEAVPYTRDDEQAIIDYTEYHRELEG